jgi:hypothetical protein
MLVQIGLAEQVDLWAFPAYLTIPRNACTVFAAQASIAQMKPGFDKSAAYLGKHHHLPQGVLAMTGTGIMDIVAQRSCADRRGCVQIAQEVAV